MIAPNERMTNTRLEQILRETAGQLKGGEGQWEFDVDGVRMYCITDESFDRMRIMAPIAELEELPHDVIQKCMEANFDRTLDVRYCIYQDHLWTAFIHPLSELSDGFLESALSQLAQSLKNFGSSYSSGTLVFSPQTGEANGSESASR